MAAPLTIMLKSILSNSTTKLHRYAPSTLTQKRTLFWRKKDEPQEEQEVRKMKPSDGPTTQDRLQSLKKKTGIQLPLLVKGLTPEEVVKLITNSGSVRTRKAYTPPGDLEVRVEQAVTQVCGGGDWRHVQLNNPTNKFKILTRLIMELNHDVPNLELHNMKSVEDVMTYFSKPVRDTTSYEDMSKLNLPKNMHIQMEPLRFDPDTDTMFGGRTAFPGSKTVVTGLRYKNKYGKQSS